MDGAAGPAGMSPGHEWSGTSLRFQNPDGSFGSYVDLQGPSGASGSSPDYEWSGTQIRFRNPNGSWGVWVDLKGDKGQDGQAVTKEAFALCFNGPSNEGCGCTGAEELQHRVSSILNGSCTVEVSSGVGCTERPVTAYRNGNAYVSASAHCCVCR